MSAELILFLSGFFISISAVTIGTYLTISRQSLLGDAISHALLPGLVIAFIISNSFGPFSLFMGALFSSLGISYLIEFISKKFKVREDIATGISFTAAFSLGVILLQKYAKNSHIDTDCLLFGNLIFVPFEAPLINFGYFSYLPESLMTSILMAFFTLLFVKTFHRSVMSMLFNENSNRGFSYKILKALYLSMIALSLVTGFRAMGALLVFGLLILPANIGRLYAKSFKGIVLIALMASTLSLLLSLFLAFRFDLNISALWVSVLFVSLLILNGAKK